MPGVVLQFLLMQNDFKFKRKTQIDNMKDVLHNDGLWIIMNYVFDVFITYLFYLPEPAVFNIRPRFFRSISIASQIVSNGLCLQQTFYFYLKKLISSKITVC